MSADVFTVKLTRMRSIITSIRHFKEPFKICNWRVFRYRIHKASKRCRL